MGDLLKILNWLFFLILNFIFVRIWWVGLFVSFGDLMVVGGVEKYRIWCFVWLWFFGKKINKMYEFSKWKINFVYLVFFGVEF